MSDERNEIRKEILKELIEQVRPSSDSSKADAWALAELTSVVEEIVEAFRSLPPEAGVLQGLNLDHIRYRLRAVRDEAKTIQAEERGQQYVVSRLTAMLYPEADIYDS